MVVVRALQDFAAVAMKSAVFWDVTPCSLVRVQRRFGRSTLLAAWFLSTLSCSVDAGSAFLINVGKQTVTSHP
jgi:hypothetical protein